MSQALDSLSRVEIFADLRQEDRQQLLDELETLEVERGAVLVHEGEQADALFIVLSGRFAVSVKGQKRAVAEIGAGEPLGEIAFLAGGTRTATVTALRDSVVLRLTRPHFDRIVARMPSLWQTFTIAMAALSLRNWLQRLLCLKYTSRASFSAFGCRHILVVGCCGKQSITAHGLLVFAAMTAVAPAISNALRDATGRRFSSLPITPSKILQELAR